MNTTSEQRFLEYCAHRGYRVQAIERQPNVRKTADFRVTSGGCEVIVEVKELVAAPESLRMAAKMREGVPGSGCHTHLVERVRRHVWEAAKQLRSYRTEARPMVIVLYDNVRCDGVRRSEAYSEMGDRQIDAAMFGWNGDAGCEYMDRQALARNSDGCVPGAFTHGERSYVSAVCVLYDLSGISLRIYHNCHAKVALPADMFAGPGDLHFKKLKEPEIVASSWIACATTDAAK